MAPAALAGWKTARWFGRPWQDVIGSCAMVSFLATDIPLLFIDATYVPPFAAWLTAVYAATGVVDRISYGNHMSAVLAGVVSVAWTLIGFGVHF